MDITNEEKQVIEVLVNHEKTSNAYGQPIFAVDKAMKWDTATTLEMVKDLERRNLVVRKMDPLKGLADGEAIPKLKSWWERV
jgi:DNA-binding MarR family transcriptional regulator